MTAEARSKPQKWRKHHFRQKHDTRSLLLVAWDKVNFWPTIVSEIPLSKKKKKLEVMPHTSLTIIIFLKIMKPWQIMHNPGANINISFRSRVSLTLILACVKF